MVPPKQRRKMMKKNVTKKASSSLIIPNLIEKVTGRVMIDTFAFEKFESGCITELEEVEGAKERSAAKKSEQSSMSAIFDDLAKESRECLRPSVEA
ncbi:MAG: hypothetical protein Q9208_003902 [Pyrenodesmia sp. 3 TL-2023]